MICQGQAIYSPWIYSTTSIRGVVDHNQEALGVDCALTTRICSINERRMSQCASWEEIMTMLSLSKLLSLLPPDQATYIKQREPKPPREAARIATEFETTVRPPRYGNQQTRGRDDYKQSSSYRPYKPLHSGGRYESRRPGKGQGSGSKGK